MHDGGVVRNVATWHVLIEGVDGMTLGFPATFQFPWIFGFKTFFFFLHFDFCFECYLPCLFLRLLRFYSGDSDLAPVTPTLLWRRFFPNFSSFDRFTL